jgi:hypothetical protein
MKSRLAVVFLAVSAAACSDAPTSVSRVERSPALDANAVSSGTSTVRWNRKALALFRARGGNPGRALAYLGVAQYRAALAATDAKQGQARPSVAGAVAAASARVLKQFYPLDVGSIDSDLAAQRAEEPFGSERNRDFSSGEAIGDSVGLTVLALAATDNFGLTNPGTPPVGAGKWVSSGAPIVRGGYGARPFFLTSGSELRRGPPPAFGSAEFLAALAEVRAFSDGRTPAQVAITQAWVPFSGAILTGVTTDMIDKYHRSEVDAARILAYANTAAFDAIIACFDTKFTYWFIRPTQADPGITTAVGLPNHPSYPSAHSCESGAFEGILVDAFPAEREEIEALVQQANMSRIIGGLHYSFDGQAGLAIGRETAHLALTRRSIEN